MRKRRRSVVPWPQMHQRDGGTRPLPRLPPRHPGRYGGAIRRHSWVGEGKVSRNDPPLASPWPDDPALVAACLAGDQRAWEAVVDRYGRLVFSIPRRAGLSEADADDVFQAVFAALLRALPTLRDRARLSSWLITTARRESWRVSARVRAGGVELDETTPDGADAPIDEVTRREREQAVRAAMARLDPPCRDLLAALFLDPDPAAYGVIADRLGMAIGSIGPTRARCFRKLEPLLREAGIDEALDGDRRPPPRSVRPSPRSG